MGFYVSELQTKDSDSLLIYCNTRENFRGVAGGSLLQSYSELTRPDTLRLLFYGSVTNRENLQEKCWQNQSLELTKSSANVSESNAVISECNSLAFSFPRFDAKTRNWASSAASRAQETVTGRLYVNNRKLAKKNTKIQHTDFPGCRALQNILLQ